MEDNMKNEKIKRSLIRIGLYIIAYPILYFYIKFDGLHYTKNSDIWYEALIALFIGILFVEIIQYFNNKRKEKVKNINKENKMIDEINKFLISHNAKLLRFEVNYKAFGDLVVEIEFNNIKHLFIIDKGEIYHNQKFLCNNSYHEVDKNDTFPKLLEMIEKELFQ